MNQFFQKSLCFFLTLLFVIVGSSTVLATDTATLDSAITDTAAVMVETVKNPQVGGEWSVIGLARSGQTIPNEYFQNYYKTVEDYVKVCNGLLHPKKYTEYSRLIVALTSIRKDPANVAGYNLLTALGDYDKTIWQGLNGPVWALIALDSGNYAMPQNSEAKTQATRELYVNRILACQLSDGGFSLFGGTTAVQSEDDESDPDITGMALQALSHYQDREDVKQAIKEALSCMSNLQNDNGGYASWDTDNSESVVQMIVALTALGISLDDPRFVKNGNTLLDNLMTYYKKGNGFHHTNNGDGSNQMATEQGFYGLVAAKRAVDGKNSLYQMSDAIQIPDMPIHTQVGLDGKQVDVTSIPITSPGITFPDINAHKNQVAIEALASRGIITGKSKDRFDPDGTMTRAEFATIIVRGLGLPINQNPVFEDVSVKDWFSSYVNTAFHYGIVTGTTATTFHPNGSITREEAAVMLTRAATLCGMDADMDPVQSRDVLAGFTDYMKASEWAKSSLAFCYRENILPNEEIEILPKSAIKRAEIAQMLFNMLGRAKLL
jgi:S-layer homology domain.